MIYESQHNKKMKLKLLKIGTIALAISLLSMPAKSADVGLAIGVVGSFSDFTSTGTETEGNDGVVSGNETNGPLTIVESVEFANPFAELVIQGDLLGITWGADWIPGEHTIGARTRTDSSTGADVAAEADTGDRVGKAEVDNMVTTYLEPTLYIWVPVPWR